MERPQGLFLVFLFFVGIVTGSAPAHGRIQIRGGHESSPEDVVSFDTECKCNRDEEMSISVSLSYSLNYGHKWAASYMTALCYPGRNSGENANPL